MDGGVMFPTTPKLTFHARKRAMSMKVRTKEVKRTLADPELNYDSKHYGCKVAVAGRLAVPYKLSIDGVTRIAITVLWRGQEGR